MEHELVQLGPGDVPARLFEIPQPPKKLWCRGTLPAPDIPWLSVVGSRKYSSYGKEACEYLISGLRGYDVAIVSGLALGIDAIAHRAALDAGLPCVGVPGSGLDWKVLYPRSNYTLAHDIIERGGALLSEYAPDAHAAPWMFPERNRIMVGLSHAVLLIEAGEKSGTLITARLTAEYNRDLLALPGSIFNEGTKGTHQFIRLGATLVSSPEEILDALGIDASATQATLPLTLTSDEAEVLHLLHEPMSRDTLLAHMKKPAHHVQVLIAQMELSGLIVERNGMLRRA